MDKNLAIEILRGFLENPDNTKVKEAILELHPELAESKDEKIRKEILEFVQTRGGFKGEWIAYLEKQKDQKPADDKAFEEWIDDWWKHNRVNNPDSYDKGDEIQFDEQGFKNFCRGIRNMYQQKPAEWSEEDKKTISFVIDVLRTNHPDGFFKTSAAGDIHVTSITTEDLVKKLKSLLNHPKLSGNWKPNEDQMDALRYVKQFEDGGVREFLESLYEDLKKL